MSNEYYANKRIIQRQWTGDDEGSSSLVTEDWNTLLEGFWHTVNHLGDSLIAWAERRDARIRSRIREMPSTEEQHPSGQQQHPKK